MSRMDKSGIEKRIVGEMIGSEEMGVDMDVIKGRVVRSKCKGGGGRYLCDTHISPSSPDNLIISGWFESATLHRREAKCSLIKIRVLEGNASSTISGNPEAQH